MYSAKESSDILGALSAEDDEVSDVEDETSGGLSNNIEDQDASESDPSIRGVGVRAPSHT